MSVGNDAAAGINARGPVRMVGVEEQVELRIPYVESYVPAGRRKPKHFAFWSTLPIGVLRVEAGDLTPAYRVIPPERRANAPSYAVRSFRGALWWPVSAGDVAMTPAAFRARAARGDMEIVGMLGAETFRSVYESRESFHAEFPYGKTVADTREQQWTRAQRGATERILFCGDEVLLDAGEPIHYFGSYADFVGPAFSNRHVKLPSRDSNREWIAHRGAAYGVEEIEKRCAGGVAFDPGRRLERIEVLVERHRIDGAALACARALVRHLVWRSMLPTVCGARLRQRFAGSFSNLDDRDLTDVELCRNVLHMARIRDDRKDLTWENGVARDILKRLDELSPPRFDDVEDEALATLSCLFSAAPTSAGLG
jgi:hypothetical protein